MILFIWKEIIFLNLLLINLIKKKVLKPTIKSLIQRHFANASFLKLIRCKLQKRDISSENSEHKIEDPIMSRWQKIVLLRITTFTEISDIVGNSTSNLRSLLYQLYEYILFALQIYLKFSLVF